MVELNIKKKVDEFVTEAEANARRDRRDETMVEENYGANFRAVEVENSRIKEVLGQRSRRYNLLPGNAPSNAADLCL